MAFVLAAILVLGAAVLVSGCGGGSASGSGDRKFGGTGLPGVNDASSRAVKKGPIERSTASSLQVAWTLPLTAQSTYGAYAATPVIVNGVIYSQDLASDVQAIDLESGEVIWTKKYDVPDQGPNGVVVAEGKVFGATASDAFALDQETGEELWSVSLPRNASEAIDIAPGYHDGMVYVSTVPTNVSSQYPAGGVGTLFALDAETGQQEWTFDTVPKGLWGKPEVNAGGGLWYPPSFDQNGFMYFGVGNPAPFPGAEGEPWGSSRPGPNLYTNSVVKMNTKTGEMRWYYQQTPHDVYDWDFQNSPILTEAKGRKLVIGSGKSGVVVALDRETGVLVWERPVGRHSGHDDDGRLAMRGEFSKLKPGSTIYPGTLGGVIAPIAANKTTVFAPVVNHPISSDGVQIQEAPESTGELVAVDIVTGKIKWTAEFAAPAFGAPTVVNDLVFLATFDGIVRAFDAETGGEVWQATLPASYNSGLMASGDMLIVPAGLATGGGQQPQIVAYRLGGE